MTAPARRRTLLLAAVAGLALAAGACVPAGGEPPSTDADLDIDLASGTVTCEPAPAPGEPYPVCEWDTTITVTNTGTEPTFAAVNLLPRTYVSEQGDRTVTTISNDTCGVVLAPMESCTADVHAEAEDTQLNGVRGRIDVYSGALEPRTITFIRTTG